MSNTLLEGIDLIDQETELASVDVITALSNSYMKAKTILENCSEDADLSGFSVFQEDATLKDTDYDDDSDITSGQKPKKKKSVGKIIAKILLFIPRLILFAIVLVIRLIIFIGQIIVFLLANTIGRPLVKAHEKKMTEIIELDFDLAFIESVIGQVADLTIAVAKNIKEVVRDNPNETNPISKAVIAAAKNTSEKYISFFENRYLTYDEIINDLDGMLNRWDHEAYEPSSYQRSTAKLFLKDIKKCNSQMKRAMTVIQKYKSRVSEEDFGEDNDLIVTFNRVMSQWNTKGADLVRKLASIQEQIKKNPASSPVDSDDEEAEDFSETIPHVPGEFADEIDSSGNMKG